MIMIHSSITRRIFTGLLALCVILGALFTGASGIRQAWAASDKILIAEVFNATLQTDEWVVLANIGSTPEDLSGWTIRDYTGAGNIGSTWSFPDGVIIEPYSLLVVERTKGGAGVPTESGVQTIVGGAFNLAADSDRVDLLNASNRLVDGVAWGTFNEVEGFRIRERMGQQSSFERMSLIDTDSDADWRGVTPAIAWEWAPLGEIELTGGPKPLVTVPVDGENGAEPGRSIVVEYDKPIRKNFGTITIFNVSDHEMFASIPVTEESVTIGGPEGGALFVNTEHPFAPGKTYQATVPGGSVLSMEGDVRNATVSWMFTVGIAEGTTPPPEGYRIEYIRHADTGKGEIIGYPASVSPGSTVYVYANREGGDDPLTTATASDNGAFYAEFDNPDKLLSIYVSAADVDSVESDTVMIDAKGFYTTSLQRTVDGDTIVLNGRILGSDRIRLLSIDTPEEAQQYGRMAKDVLDSLIGPNEELIIELGVEPKDAYDRLLAHIYRKRDGLDLNKELLRMGAAVPYYISPNLSYFEEYAAATLEAKEAGRGIWNPADPLEVLPYEYRFMNDGRGGPDKYVADYATKKLYEPEKYTEIDVQNRIFFFRNEVNEAQMLGFEWAGSGSSPFRELTGELISIEEARQRTPNTKVRVRGEVTAVFPENAWIQDGTAGIRLYGGATAGLKVGDEIELDGMLKIFNEDKEITDFTYIHLEGDHIPTPEPVELNSIADIGEHNLGQLVRLTDVWIKQDYHQAEGGVVVTDGMDDLVVYAYAGDRLKNYMQSLFKGERHKLEIVGPSMLFGDSRQLSPRNPGDIHVKTGDVYAPQLLAQKPLQNAINVAAHPEIELIFDEPLRQGEGVVTVRNVLSGQAAVELDVESSHIMIGGINRHRIHITLPEPLDPGMMYDVEIPAGAFLDLSGNASPAIVVTFTTERRTSIAGEITGFVRAEARDDLSDVRLIATVMDTGDEIQLPGLVQADGSFTIYGTQLAEGEYKLRAELRHHVAVEAENVLMEPGLVTDIGNLSSAANGGSTEGAMRAGDVTADGVIDIYDAALIAEFYGIGTEYALAAADVNGDGIVNELDMSWVKNHMLTDILH